MTNSGLLIINCFMAFFSTKILKKYLDILLIPSSISYRRNELILGMYFLIQIYMEQQKGEFPFVKLMINIVLVFSIALTSYLGSLYKKIMFSILIYAIWMSSELLVGYVFMVFHIEYNGVEYLGSFVSKIIVLIILNLTYFYMQPKTNIDIPIKYWIGLLIFPISSIYLMDNIFRRYMRKDSFDMFPFICSISLIYVNYIIFEVYEKLSKELEVQKNNAIFEQQLEICAQQSAEQIEIIDKTSKMRHDMKHHLVYLQKLVENGYQIETLDYLKNLGKENKLFEHEIIKSGNIMIDALVNYKYSVAKKDGIDFRAKIFVPCELPFESSDVCIILGNALDNAIEATQKLEDEKKFIEIIVNYSKETLSLGIQNSFDGIIKEDLDGNIITSKANTKEHGIGLISIRKAINKYNGEMVIENKDKIFKLLIFLYV